jgi:hypothetical protein
MTVVPTSPLIVRPRSYWRQNLLVSLAAFVLTVAVVYFFSRIYLPKSAVAKNSKAIATVEVKQAASSHHLPADCLFRSPWLSKEIKSHLKSEEFLRQALRNCGIKTPASNDKFAQNASLITVEKLWQGLSVRDASGAASGVKRITLELTLSNSDDAPKIARALADAFVGEYRTYWAAEAQKAYLDALARTQHAEEAHRTAEAKLQAFRDDLAKQEKVPQTRQTTENQVLQKATTQTIDNPLWLELKRKLETLKKQEAELLGKMNPVHPEIIYIRDNIADIEHQLSVTPRWIMEFPAGNTPRLMASSPPNQTLSTQKQNKPAQVEINTDTKNTKTAETLKQLQEDAELTGLEYQDKLEHEKQIYKATRLEPTFLVNVSPVATANTQQTHTGRLLGLMLFGGFAMAVGTGFFSSGLTTEPPVATIADLEPLLPVPIIGVAPGQEGSANPLARKRRQTILRWTLILLGGMIIIGCMGSVSWCFSQLA